MGGSWGVATVFAVLLMGTLYRYYHISKEIIAEDDEARLAQRTMLAMAIALFIY